MDDVDTIDNITINNEIDKDDKPVKGFEFYKNIDQLNLFIDGIYNKLIKTLGNLREIKNDMKKLKDYHDKVEMKVKNKMNEKSKNNKPKGFYELKKVPDNLAKLLNLEIGIKLRRTTVVKLIHEQLNKRGLKYDKDKRVFRADHEFMEVFGFDNYVNKATDPKDKKSFSLYTIQSHLGRLYSNDEQKNNKKQKEKKVE